MNMLNIFKGASKNPRSVFQIGRSGVIIADFEHIQHID